MTLSAICAALGRAQRASIGFRIATIAGLALLITAFSGCGGGASTATDTTPPTFAGIKSISPQASSITLSWGLASDSVTAAQDIVYLVYRASTAGGENYASPTYTSARGALSYDDTVLTPGTSYYYVVRAMDMAGNIDKNTVELSASTDTTPPTFGGATGAAAAGSTSVTVSWTAATDNITLPANITYLIYRATNSGGQVYTTPTATTATGATSYTDTGLTSGATYYYVVRAKDQAGNIDTNTVQVAAAPTLDTTPPTFAGATGAATQGSSAITVGWNAATDNLTSSANIVYLVYRSTTTGFAPSSTTLIATTAAGALSYADSGLTASTAYYYVVRAQDQAGNIDTNTVHVNATTNVVSTDTTPPTFTGANSLTVQAGTSMTVSWSQATDNVTANSGIVYKVYRGTSSGGENLVTPVGTVTGSPLYYVDTTATTTTKYYYLVYAVDQAGNVASNTSEVFGPVSFANDIYTPLISSSAPKPCAASGCHATATISNGGLSLANVSTAYTNLTTMTSTECTTEKYAAAGSSSTSYLVNKLTGTWTCGSGSQMPKGGPYFTPTQINTVKAWIDQGAQNN